MVRAPSRAAGRRGRAGADPGREFVQGIDRGFAVVRALSAERGGRTIAEIAAKTALSRAVARRYLFTLQKLGYVAQDESAFTLAPRIRELGFAYLSTVRLPHVAQPFMDRLVSTLHESCSIAVLDGAEVVYIARAQADRIMSINLAVGSRFTADATAVGPVLLAQLSPRALDDRIGRIGRIGAPPTARTAAAGAGELRELRRRVEAARAAGWDIVDSRIEEGIRSVAVPIPDRSVPPPAAISLSVHAARVSIPELKRVHLPLLLQTAARIADALERAAAARS